MLANLPLALAAILSLASASVIPLDLSARSGKPTGGPAIASVTIYSSYTCPGNTAPPTDGSAGASTTLSVTEATCSIVSIPAGAAITAKLTQAPKTGSVGCYVQLYYGGDCAVTYANQIHGVAFSGVAVNNHLGCANFPVGGYGAVEIICV
ncbi:hypothetical protein BU16DRAFT_523553 [Lophium mytilinum]|uniref:Ubiquitin 3 binding protein But2 C-terminal domain-containing protein n=1 Tax=Lophium mytilinum TaxID=390894 RepID=A0A6A6R8R6_9PEZI|nr:hypothetical protein BU16DRAFT_523553 [Lophium mytilinum]